MASSRSGRPRKAIRPTMAKHDVIHKTELHNVAECCHKRTEPGPQGIYTENFVRICPAVPEICSWTDRQTHGQKDRLIRILRTPTRRSNYHRHRSIVGNKNSNQVKFTKQQNDVYLFPSQEPMMRNCKASTASNDRLRSREWRVSPAELWPSAHTHCWP